MATDIDPIIGNWYRNTTEKGQRFEVVSLDEEAGLVEVQHFDGDVEEWDIDEWYNMDLEAIEPPENWTGPMDDVTDEDIVYMPTDMSEEEWQEPFDEVKRRAKGQDEEYEGDEWGRPGPPSGNEDAGEAERE